MWGSVAQRLGGSVARRLGGCLAWAAVWLGCHMRTPLPSARICTCPEGQGARSLTFESPARLLRMNRGALGATSNKAALFGEKTTGTPNIRQSATRPRVPLFESGLLLPLSYNYKVDAAQCRLRATLRVRDCFRRPASLRAGVDISLSLYIYIYTHNII